MKKIYLVLLAVVAVAILAGCGGSSYIQDGKIKESITEQTLNDRFVEVVGIGRSDQNIPDITGRRAVSRNAAVVDAQYRLVSIVKGVKITGGVTIEKAMETDSKIKATVDDSVRGATTTKTEWTADDGCMVTMRLDKEGLAKQLGITIEK